MEQLINLLGDLGGDGAKLGRVVTDTFGKIEEVEARIYNRMRTAPSAELRQKYWNTFAALCPPAVLSGLDDKLYWAHVEELINRVRDGESLKPLTEPEQLAYLSRASLEHPPDHYTYSYYLWLFVRVYQGDNRALSVFDECDGGGMWENIEGLRADALNGVEPYAVQQGRERLNKIKSDREELPRELREVPAHVSARL